MHFFYIKKNPTQLHISFNVSLLFLITDILYFCVNLRAPSSCHFAAGTPAFSQWGTIKDNSILFY